ncbi:MAG: ribonuclease HII [Pseudomonadota bacterium]
MSAIAQKGAQHAAQTGAGRHIAGVDEAGRGPWAGPVFAAAVILDPDRPISGLADSKKLSAARRDALYGRVTAEAHAWSIATADVEEIDRLNIYHATLLAMQRAIAGLATAPDLALIDGNAAPALACPTRTIVKGDALEPAISAASILAKVARDRLMAELDRQHPGFGWARNKGYGTAEHAAGLKTLGVTAHHRRSFRPVAACLGDQQPQK